VQGCCHIRTYKILTGKYHVETTPSLVGVCSSVTRGHSLSDNLRLRLQKIGQNMIYAIFLANRIVNIWNSLPNHVVSAEMVNCFKTRLDIFWLNQDIIYIIIVLKFTEPEAEVKLQLNLHQSRQVVVLFRRAKRLSSLRLFSFYVYERQVNSVLQQQTLLRLAVQ